MTVGHRFWDGQKVLVTGGASFIGSHLVERLLRLGASVRVADDLSSGNLENLAVVAGEFDFREGDLRHPAFAAEATRKIDTVFHLAASHGGRGYIDTHSVECCTNMVLDGAVFAGAQRSDVQRICYASSACVYPVSLQAAVDPADVILLSEDLVDSHCPNGANPDGEYGWAKLMGELVLGAYHRQTGVEAVACRIFSAYGERENETHAVTALIAKALAKYDPYVIWGNGQQRRNFTYVTDIVEGMVSAAEIVTDASAVNIGAEWHLTVTEVANLILAETGFTPQRIEYDAGQPSGVVSRAADVSRATALLDWEPSVSPKEGISRTVDWYCRTHAGDKRGEALGRLLYER